MFHGCASSAQSAPVQSRKTGAILGRGAKFHSVCRSLCDKALLRRSVVLMRSRLSPAEVLVSLAAQSDVAERRASFRQVVAALGQQSDLFSVSELDRVDVGQLVRACRAALQSGLLDDLDWIAPGAATLALYEITQALPPGEERREFGRRVF